MIAKRVVETSLRERPFYLRYAKNYTSQHGEDGILEFLFQSIYNVSDLTGVKGYCIDVGAWDGLHWSNTNHLIATKNWDGLLIEANEERFRSMCSLYSERVKRQEVLCLQAIADCQGENSLLNLLKANNVPLVPSFLTIDIDGADYHLWESIYNGGYCPDVVCIEFNPTVPNDVYFIQPADIRVQKGSSLLALTSLGRRLGYALIACTTFNAIFVHSSHLSKLPYVPNQDDLDAIHTPTMITEMFQTYDGELVYVGTKKLLWHDVALNSQQLQILSKKQQKFPFSPYEVQVQQELQLLHTKSRAFLNSILLLSPDVDESFTVADVDALAKFLSLPTFQGLALRAWKEIFTFLRRIGKALSEEGVSLSSMAWEDVVVALLEAWTDFSNKLIPHNVQLAIEHLRTFYDSLESWKICTNSPMRRLFLLLTLYKSEAVLSLVRCARLLEDDFYSDYWLEYYEKNLIIYHHHIKGYESDNKLSEKYQLLVAIGEKEKKKKLHSKQKN